MVFSEVSTPTHHGCSNNKGEAYTVMHSCPRPSASKIDTDQMEAIKNGCSNILQNLTILSAHISKTGVLKAT
jgi:hypothetical protein